MRKKKYLIIFSFLLLSSVISLAYFSSIDSSNDNYIQIGKLKKYTRHGVYGGIFKYDASEKRNLSANEWLTRASFTSLGKRIKVWQHHSPVNIHRISYFDKISLTSDYIIALYTLDVEKNGTVFDVTNLSMDISTNSGVFKYTYHDLYRYIKGFEYFVDSKTIKETTSHQTSCAVIDLSNVLKNHIKSQKLWIYIRTNQGNIEFKIKG